MGLFEVFLQQGQEAVENGGVFYHTSFPLNVSITEFLQLFDQVISNKDFTILTGFSYSIAPYLMKNIDNFQEIELSNLWVKLSYILYDLPFEGINGVIEALHFLHCRFNNVPLTFLLSIVEMAKNKVISVPYVLFSIYEVCPLSFYEQNRVIFLPLFIEPLKRDCMKYFHFLCRLIVMMKCSFKEIFEVDSLQSVFWESIIFLVSNGNLVLLYKDLQCLRSWIPEFFATTPSFVFLVDKVLDCDFIEESLVHLKTAIVLLPFLDESRFEVVFRLYIASLSHILSRNEGMHESFKILKLGLPYYTEHQLSFLSLICEKELDSVNYPSALSVWSLFEPLLFDVFPRSTEILIKRIVDGFLQDYPLKIPLYFSLCNIIEEAIDVIDTNIDFYFPIILSGTLSNNYFINKYSFKILEKLVKLDSVSIVGKIGELFFYVGSIQNHAIAPFFKFISSLYKDQDKIDNSLIETTHAYVIDLFSNMKMDWTIRINSLSCFLNACTYRHDLLECFWEKAIKTIADCLNQNNEALYPQVFDMIDFFCPHSVPLFIYNLVLKAYFNDQAEKSVILNAIACLCLHDPELPMPITIEELSNMSSLQSKALFLSKMCNYFQVDQMVEFLEGIVTEFRVSTNIIFVNSVYRIASSIIKNSNKIVPVIQDIINTSFQSRTALLDHQPLYYKSSSVIVLYSLLNKLIIKFPSHCFNYVRWIGYYVPYISASSLPKLIKPLRNALSFNLVNRESCNAYYQCLLCRVAELPQNFYYVSSIMDFLFDICVKYSYSDLSHFLSVIEDEWEQNSKDNDFVCYLSPLVIQITILYKGLEGKSDIFSRIVKCIISNKYSFDHEKMALLFLDLYRVHPTKECISNSSFEVLNYYISKPSLGSKIILEIESLYNKLQIAGCNK